MAVVEVVLFRRKHRDGGAWLLARVCRLLRRDSRGKQHDKDCEAIPAYVSSRAFRDPQTLTTVTLDHIV